MVSAEALYIEGVWVRWDREHVDIVITEEEDVRTCCGGHLHAIIELLPEIHLAVRRSVYAADG